jgi:hypothetical protein
MEHQNGESLAQESPITDKPQCYSKLISINLAPSKFFFILDLFNNTFSNMDFTALNDRMVSE